MGTPTRAPLTAAQLDQMTCQEPGCTSDGCGPLFLQSHCHPAAGTRVSYRLGELVVACRVCGTWIATIKVAAS